MKNEIIEKRVQHLRAEIQRIDSELSEINKIRDDLKKELEGYIGIDKK